MLIALIVGIEIAFWVLLASGLAARYMLLRRRLSTVLLASVPLVDLVLLIATVAHFSSGGTAEAAHGLAAAYLGVSVAFGPSLIRWADARFAHRFAGGPPPQKPPRAGAARVRYEWREFGKAALAWTISVSLLGAAIAIIGDAERTEALAGWIVRLTGVLAIWSIWPLSYSVQQVIGRRPREST
jgi:hypothetical protein